jgi:cytoskeletal protein RodZ
MNELKKLAVLLALLVAGAAQAQLTVDAGATSGSNSNSNSNSNSDARSISAGGNANQGQDQGQQQGQRQKSTSSATQGQDASNTNTINFGNTPAKTEATIITDTNIHGTQSIKSAPAIGMGILSPTTPCSNTYQLGVSGMGFGVGAGGSVVDLDCTRREYARILWAAGATHAAIGMLCQNEELQKVAPVMCKDSRDRLTAGTLPTNPLPAYPSNTLPPAPAPKAELPAPPVAAAPPVEREARAVAPQANTVASVPPASPVSGPKVGDVMKGNDGVTYRFTGSAWVKIMLPRQPLVDDAESPFKKVNLTKNEVIGRDVPNP